MQANHSLIVYTGSSATASFLQEVRSLVSAAVGPCPFTVDANQYNDDENSPQSLPCLASLPALPPRKQALVIADLFISNVCSTFAATLMYTDVKIECRLY